MSEYSPVSIKDLQDLLRVLRENKSVDQIITNRSGYLPAMVGVYLYREKPPQGFGGLSLSDADFERLKELLVDDDELRQRKIRLIDK